MPKENICAGWVRTPLEQCVESIIDYRGKTPIKTTFGVPLITAKVIKNGRIDWDNVTEFISENDYESWMKRGIPIAGAVVITTEAPLGEVAQLGADKIALAQRVITLCGKAGMLNNTFLRYLLQTNYVQGQLLARGSGTTVTGIKQSELRKVLLPFPPLPEQQAIAAILSALDDKIELNRQMNKTLEEMAQAIFKEWFVDFGPFQDGGLQDSELGPIPVGWRVTALRENSEKISKGTTPTNQAMAKAEDPCSVYFLKVKDISDSGSIDITRLDTIPRSIHEGILKRSILQTGDVLISIAGTIGKVSILPHELNDSNSNQAIAFIRPQLDSTVISEFIRLLLKSDRAQTTFQSRIVQGVQPNLSLTEIGNLQFALPPDTVIYEWQAIGKAIGSYKGNIERETVTLSTLRDTLLPKLMSGELRVPVSDNAG